MAQSGRKKTFIDAKVQGALVLFFMLPAFIVDTIKLSHRFAGPIFRLRGVFRSLASGEKYQPLRFREMDFWQELADDFNRMVERLRTDKGESHAATGLSDVELRESAIAR
jgi:nitrogen fixation/metabolism regulation signal transduction histidine kinase